MFRPHAFVDLAFDDDPAVDTGLDDEARCDVDLEAAIADAKRRRPIKTNEIRIAISREMALDYGLVEPTPEEAAARAASLAEFRRQEAERRALPAVVPTLDALLAALDWSAPYAAHFLHPACTCQVWGDDPYLCSWGTELGFVRVGGEDQQP